ncbi:MAG: hypothetical protein GC193_15305 [Cryomorphaceae bacterium]|nr:hypothetical protein [Cryomorphaceae bacterium]
MKNSFISLLLFFAACHVTAMPQVDNSNQDIAFVSENFNAVALADSINELAIGCKEFRGPLFYAIVSREYSDQKNFELRKSFRLGEYGKNVVNKKDLERKVTNFLIVSKVDCYEPVDRPETSEVEYYLTVAVDSVRIECLNKKDKTTKSFGKMVWDINVRYILKSVANVEVFNRVFIGSSGVEDCMNGFTPGTQVDLFHKALKDCNEQFFADPDAQAFIQNSRRNFDPEYHPIVIKQKSKGAAIPDNSTILIDRFAAKIGDVSEAFVSVKSRTERGSGIAISNDGWILTSFELADYCDSVDVYLKNDLVRKGAVVRRSRKNGVVLIKIEDVNLTAVKVRPGFPEVADKVYTTSSLNFDVKNFSVSSGIISGLRKQEEGDTRIQFDAPINDSSLGSPLLNEQIEIVGVITGRMVGVGTEGLGFATSINDVLNGLGLTIE